MPSWFPGTPGECFFIPEKFMPLLDDCEPTVQVTSPTPECWRWFRWPRVQSAWQHNKGRPESLLCQSGGCSLDPSYTRNVKAACCCYALHHKKIHCTLFSLMSWALECLAFGCIRHFYHSDCRLSYVAAFQSVPFVSEAENETTEEKKSTKGILTYVPRWPDSDMGCSFAWMHISFKMHTNML